MTNSVTVERPCGIPLEVMVCVRVDIKVVVFPEDMLDPIEAPMARPIIATTTTRATT